MTDMQQQADPATPIRVPPEIVAADRIAAPVLGPAEVVTNNAPPLEAAHTDFAEFHEGYVSRYIELADTKASWAFAIAAGAIAFMAGNDHIRAMLGGDWNSAFVLVLTTSMLLLVSSVFSFLVIAPRLGNSSGEGLVYFGAVAQMKSAEAYVRAISSHTEAQMTEARLKHCYELSRICTRKYEYLGKAICVGIPALCGLASVLLMS
jgi:hypothetical protein